MTSINFHNIVSMKVQSGESYTWLKITDDKGSYIALHIGADAAAALEHAWKSLPYRCETCGHRAETINDADDCETCAEVFAPPPGCDYALYKAEKEAGLLDPPEVQAQRLREAGRTVPANLRGY